MLEVSRLSKKFGDSWVLQDISFQVGPGEIYGIIGYNGVGKTTLLKLIQGIYRPDGGGICAGGATVYENEKVKQDFFFMSEELCFFPQATLEDMRHFYKGYYKTWNDKTFEGLQELFQIPGTNRISSFSKGMQRQAALILAFAARPQYLLLDEAFDGLDVTVRGQVRQMLRYYAETQQAYLLVTSHNLQELEDLADRVGMLDNGRMVLDASMEEIQGKYEMTLEEYFQRERGVGMVDWSKIFG